ncbi:hypothetical protein R1sor_000660 [Riccia sorocarpa]|uniref:CCHC-type domain-containing protein n=1 Tax=Riccia sorocarpa TaxID=122646 RepID=A0ABD3GTT1_9MARC
MQKPIGADLELVVYKADSFIYELAELILQTVGTVLYKELVGNDRGGSKLRAVIGTVIEEFPTTLEVPITTDFTIFVQLDYEGLHLRCFKCGSLDHKADECENGRKQEGVNVTTGDQQGKGGESSGDTSSSAAVQEGVGTVQTAEQAPQKSVARHHRRYSTLQSVIVENAQCVGGDL